jgi:hypothetical protein
MVEGTATELAASRSAADGRLGAQEALDLFASVFGPLPGATDDRLVPRGGDGSLAIRAVLRVWDDLTADQQAAVEAVLLGPGQEASTAGEGGAIVEVSRQAIDLATEGARAQAALETALGRPLTLPVTIETVPAGSLGETETGGVIRAWAMGTAGGRQALDGPADACLIRVDVSVVNYSDLVHEYFHCFQYDSVDTALIVYDTPDWIVEGSAKWAEARIAGPSDSGAAAWGAEWVASTGSVFLLDYAAVGFFWTIEDMGGDPWTFMLDMLGNEGEEAVAITGFEPGDVAPRMASEKAEAHMAAPTFSVTNVWQLVAPDAPNRAARMAGTVTESSPIDESFSTKEWAPLFPGQVTFAGEGIVHVRVKADAGFVEFEDKESEEVFGSFDRRYCKRAEGCTCGADGEVDSELPEASEDLLVTGIRRSDGELGFLIEIEDEPDRFPEGVWEGSLSITTVRFGAAGSQVVGETRAAPFNLTVDNGAVTGDYTWIQDQRMDMGDGAYVEGVGTLTGFFSGCSYLPVANSIAVTVDGVADFADGLGVRPFNFTQPVGGAPDARPWNFETVTDSFVSGTIDAAPNIAQMRASGLDYVDDVTIVFEASRVG